MILATADGNGTSYFLDDVNKNVKQKIDLNGIQEATYSYSPFGGVIGTDKAHIGFSSEFYDTENNMNYYNFRYISNRIARWNKRDPVGVAGGNNEYSFLNNQMNNNDFLGLDKDRNDKVRRHREISEQLLIQKLINDFEQWYLNAYNEIYDDNGNIKDDSWILKLTPCPYKIDVKHQTVKMITSAGVIYLYETYLGYDRNEWNEGVFFPFTRDTYHPGGVYELRSRNPIDGHGNQCVYDSCGNILFSKPGAGSADYSVPELPWPTKHRENDVIPYNIIIYLKKKGIKVDAMIEKYYNVRPSIYYGEDGKRRINSVIF